MPESAVFSDRKVFISYSSQDREVATAVHSALKNLGIVVWIDRENVFAGDSIASAVSAGLAGVDTGIVLLSKSYLASPWCRKEMEALLTQEIENCEASLIPAKLDDAELPPLMRAKRFVDLRKGVSEEAQRELAYAISRSPKQVGSMPSTPSEQSSVLGMVISSVLRDYPASGLHAQAALSPHDLGRLYQAVELLIGRFQELFESLLDAIESAGIRRGEKGSLYGSAARLNRSIGIESLNRKLVSIAEDMREIAKSLDQLLPEASEIRARFVELLQICASISVLEDFVVIDLHSPNKPESAPRDYIPLLPQQRRHEAFFSLPKTMDDYVQALWLLDAYKRDLRRVVARLKAETH
jgi:hypothetical protein